VKIKITRLTEATEKEVQDVYLGTVILSMRQSKNVDRTKVMNFIRAIPHITTIRRDKEISTSKELYVGQFSIRIVLKYGSNIKHYLDTVLKSEINKIDGVLLRSFQHLEKVS